MDKFTIGQESVSNCGKKEFINTGFMHSLGKSDRKPGRKLAIAEMHRAASRRLSGIGPPIRKGFGWVQTADWNDQSPFDR
jgi:hypothetical protein